LEAWDLSQIHKNSALFRLAGQLVVMMLSKSALLVSFLLFCSSISIHGLFYYHKSRYSKIEEWRLDQDWKIAGIAHRIQTHLATGKYSSSGKLELNAQQITASSLQIEGLLQDLLDQIRIELGRNTVLRVTWKPLQAPDPSFPTSPLLKPGRILLNTSLFNSRLGEDSTILITSFFSISKRSGEG